MSYLQTKGWCNIQIEFDNWNDLKWHKLLDDDNWMDDGV